MCAQVDDADGAENELELEEKKVEVLDGREPAGITLDSRVQAVDGRFCRIVGHGLCCCAVDVGERNVF